MVTKIAEGIIHTKYGLFKEHLYYDGIKETIALVMGDVIGKENVLCRVHSSCLSGHVFNSIECDCREQFAISQQEIEKVGNGIIIWMDQEGKSNGHYALLKSSEKRKKMTQSEAYKAIGFKSDARDFTRAAEIISELQIKSIIMLTNNPNKINSLTKHGIIVKGHKEILIRPDNEELRKTLEDKKKDGHVIDF